MRYILENEYLVVEADENGAELVSIYSKKDSTEYLWQADERYWKRHAPVLFPIVGSLSGKKLMVNGKEYPMGQHGFARDMAFSMVSSTDDTVWFALCSDEGTKSRYPYDFRLEIGYILQANKVTTVWRVTNTGNDLELHYQIGGHPAFNCPLLPASVKGEISQSETSQSEISNADISRSAISGTAAGGQYKQSDYYLHFDTEAPIAYRLLDDEGLLVDTKYELVTEKGYYKITDDMFYKDALIIEGSKVGEVSLCLPDKTPYLTVIFDSPLFGLWSPAKKNAPFVCIEPWFGRADRNTFVGDISEREYDQALGTGKSREYSFTIRVDGR